MYVKTRDLTLQPIRRQDIPAVAALFMDETVKQTYMVPDFQSKAEAEALFARLQTLSKEQDRFVVGIYFGTECVGIMNETEVVDKQIELGYAILPEYHNQGFATEALKAAIRWLLDKGFERVITGAFQENAASIRVMVKSGMKPVERHDQIEYRGAIHQCVYYMAEKIYGGGGDTP